MLNQAVLVLNQNYEPLSITPARRAVVLVWLGKAEIVERRRAVVRSVTRSIPLPSIVRLHMYVKVPRQELTPTRHALLRRDVHRCQYCGMNGRPLTIDHVIPRSQGGIEGWENLVVACVACNNRKGDRTPEQARMRLIRPPRRPWRFAALEILAQLPDERWRPYLFLD